MGDPDWTGLDRAALQAVLAQGPPALFATVSGAHLYGFPSPDSDVDLRGAFVLPLPAVLGLADPDETVVVERVQDGVELDWVAHDVRKFVRLMTRRNGYVLEQLTSPLVVQGGPWHDELVALGRGCVIRHLVHHYRGFARNQRQELEKRPTVKALLYAYRVLLTGIHVLRSGEVEADLPTLLEGVALPPDVDAAAVGDLLARKRAGREKGALAAGELDTHGVALDGLAVALEEAHGASRLPEEVTNRPALDDYVVRARLELGRE